MISFVIYCFPHTQSHGHCSLQMRLQLSHSHSTLGVNHRPVLSSQPGGKTTWGAGEAAYLDFLQRSCLPN